MIHLKETISRVEVQFTVENIGKAKGELIRFLSPRTIDSLLRILPINGIIASGQDMIYFKVPISIGVEKPKTQVDPGTIAYWPMGSAVCIFLNKSQPYSPMNIIGRMKDNLQIFNEINSGKRIKLEKS